MAPLRWSIKFVDRTGKRYGKLVAVERVLACRFNREVEVLWLCKCDCGRTKIVPSSSLASGAKSCGCRKKGRLRGLTSHGLSNSPEYRSWLLARKRCNDPATRGYKRYGGRGIIVCDKWANDFLAFLQDVGFKPTPKHTLDRIDVDGNYEPGNCRWATSKEQARNQSNNVLVNYAGRTQCISAWAEEYGIRVSTLYGRLTTQRWNIGRALTEPIRKTARRKSPARSTE